jgi:hypothetical protein
MEKEKAIERKNYGWHFLAKDVADFTNISFYDVFEKSAQEVLGTVMIMQAKIRVNENSINRF